MLFSQFDYLALIQNFGLPITLLLGLLVALWRTGKWVGTNVVQPVAARHVLFVERIERLTVEQTQMLGRISQTQNQQTDLQVVANKQLEAIYLQANKAMEEYRQGRDTALQILTGNQEKILRRLDEHKP